MENFLTFLEKYNNDIEKIFSNSLKNTLNILYNISLNKEEQIFLVGGIVRDIFLGKNSGDVDLVLKEIHRHLLFPFLINSKYQNTDILKDFLHIIFLPKQEQI